ncbi:MAG: hypothetical protein UV61_C0008G0004 [Candidatus Gottesmanbacteria bacterium GW2011_GWB1_43_11]|uniref:Uncharacterized protein n=1 Tax=Candidatus Gottesmanbacteria bacterium GW2011_GWB1_43_11 TaxID=1618446 RepID=A0A0G1ETZ2_9BACT|nr:MAG: hypothetical protein UV04_C0003G0004 [Candidatus Gottesmanbacteria bacterium GW2011_GWA2_42_16]KKS54147.1 MAG: hypothetical protein UV17_C0025G0004 [Candidatus Gottesmanbacteria bacterium GW2011_GWA1_42_26]KKS86551.1 MAG: hypothetical protein UV61_C0008G0004 [Candidatus Gottesmanbacteria bacterium GW2011_GWB1_43_11]OGG10682.1 MAG: hypothetical protein A2699_04455 [Candidatus Gottesmanbacteria bacterium RIFCSPHIGHO2_01_FULL_43_15]OGG28306.1 MAG: hypothetical protein A3A59_04600 [Candidat
MVRGERDCDSAGYAIYLVSTDGVASSNRYRGHFSMVGTSVRTYGSIQTLASALARLQPQDLDQTMIVIVDSDKPMSEVDRDAAELRRLAGFHGPKLCVTWMANHGHDKSVDILSSVNANIHPGEISYDRISEILRERFY